MIPTAPIPMERLIPTKVNGKENKTCNCSMTTLEDTQTTQGRQWPAPYEESKGGRAWCRTTYKNICTTKALQVVATNTRGITSPLPLPSLLLLSMVVHPTIEVVRVDRLPGATPVLISPSIPASAVFHALTKIP
ncbi:hypothetical protein J3R82DRAFT_3667 [Butyriboletus roseoflavus]|nr:hypothetical protein J3R82DRAFT_3667 [Butyriboletus roseoflavus]